MLSSLRLLGQWQSQQMALIGEPYFTTGRFNPDVVTFQCQFRKFKQGSKDKIFSVISPESRRSFLPVVNGSPE
jgi:hypothetical protein